MHYIQLNLRNLCSINAAMAHLLRQNCFLLTGLIIFTLFMSIGISSYIVHGQENETISKPNEFPGSNLVNTKELEIGNGTYQIRYHLSGDNQLKTMWVQTDNITLAAEISSTSDGVLTIELPRDIIDSRRQPNSDDAYAVFIDGQFVPFEEIENTTKARTLRIEFGNGTEQIEITGTHIVPEFGPLAALVLAISIASVVVVAKIKFKSVNDFFRPK
jgi:predicted secreted protein with PEFG-CTERM motif